LPSGSPLDGLLEACGWYGKDLLDAETVHPLLFRDRGRSRPVNPALVPRPSSGTTPRCPSPPGAAGRSEPSGRC
jgi:hypothetical protein